MNDMEWLQKLIAILQPDLYEVTSNGLETDFEANPVGKLSIEFSSHCYLEHTIRLVRDHIRDFDWSSVPEVHTGTFSYDTGEWEGDTPTAKVEV